MTTEKTLYLGSLSGQSVPWLSDVCLSTPGGEIRVSHQTLPPEKKTGKILSESEEGEWEIPVGVHQP